MSFDRKALRRNKLRVIARRLPRVLLIAAVFLLVGYTTFQFLSNMPRERFARGYKFFERVWLGTSSAAKMTYLKLAARHEDVKNTLLPVVEIYIKGKRLDRLNEQLPQTDVRAEKVDIKIGQKAYSGRARFRGDSMNHWAYPNRSWRIELKDGKFYRGMQVMNLNIPRVRTQISNWLGYQMAKSFSNLLSPEAEHVHFRLNRLYDGVRLFLEQPNQDFLQRRFLPPGKIFIGDISSEQIYGEVKRDKLYQTVHGWEVRAPGNDKSLEELIPLIEAIKNDRAPYSFYEQLRSIVDIDALAEYMALLELVGSLHVDDTHNAKFYFHPHTGLFTPIAWDTVAYFWGNSPSFDLGTNRLFRVALSNPEIRAKKDKILWKAINGTLGKENILALISSEHQKLRRDVHAFAFKLHANDKGIEHISNREWERAIFELREVVKEREQRYRNHITPLDVKFRAHQGSSKNELFLNIAVHSAAGFRFQDLEINGKSLESGFFQVERIGARVKSQSKKAVTGEALLSKRSFKTRQAEVIPAQYLYKITLSTPMEEQPKIVIRGEHNITGESVSFSTPDAGVKPLESISPESVWWQPEIFRPVIETVWKGVKRLRYTKRFGPYEKLIVHPGTQIILEPGTSLYFDRSPAVEFNGNAENPIIIKGASGNPWGSVALRKVKNAKLDYVKVSGGSYAILDHVRYEGQVAQHGGELSCSNCAVDGGFLSVRSGKMILNEVSVTNGFPFAVKAEQSVLRKKGVNHQQKIAYPTGEILAQDGYGTPERVEREFKFSLSGKKLAQRDLLDVASDVRKALKKHTGKNQSKEWKAPKAVGESYYVDPEAEDFLFRDIYFDTEANDNYNNQISYRYRNRFKSWKHYKNHIKRQSWPGAWPFRLEYQAKVGRKELGDGFSTVRESRFEFRKESSPFKELATVPSPPWDIDEFMTYFIEGRYHGMSTYSAQSVLRELGVKEGEEIKFKPELVLVTERYRQHLNIPTEFGSGPNPEQGYILSLDKTRIYEANGYLKYLRDLRDDLKFVRKPNELGVLFEMEVEFERNISETLDKRILEASSPKEKKRLTAIRDAFIADQQTIQHIVSKELSRQSLKLSPANKSKYVQAYEIASLGEIQ